MGFLLVPLSGGFVHGGMLFLPAVAVVGLLLLQPGWLRRFANRYKVVYTMGVAVLVIVGVVCAGLSGWMGTEMSRPANDNARTVVVLGCQVKSGEPSEMLRRRLDAALTWIAAHPDSDVIVTGGMGRGEDTTEAAVMRDYLLAHGVAAERVYLEPQARNTFENMYCSAQIIADNGLDDSVVVVTDGWHQLRARLFAVHNGLAPSPYSCHTQWIYLPGYWCRELLALLRAIVFQV